MSECAIPLAGALLHSGLLPRIKVVLEASAKGIPYCEDGTPKGYQAAIATANFAWGALTLLCISITTAQRIMVAISLRHMAPTAPLTLCGSRTTPRKLRAELLAHLTDPELVASVVAAVRAMHRCVGRACALTVAAAGLGRSASPSARAAAQAQAAGVAYNNPAYLGILAKASRYAHMLAWATSFMCDQRREPSEAAPVGAQPPPPGAMQASAAPPPPPLRKLVAALEAGGGLLAALAAALLDVPPPAAAATPAQSTLQDLRVPEKELTVAATNLSAAAGFLAQAVESLLPPPPPDVAGPGSMTRINTEGSETLELSVRAVRLLLAPPARRFMECLVERFCLDQLGATEGGGSRASGGGGSGGGGSCGWPLLDALRMHDIVAEGRLVKPFGDGGEGFGEPAGAAEARHLSYLVLLHAPLHTWALAERLGRGSPAGPGAATAPAAGEKGDNAQPPRLPPPEEVLERAARVARAVCCAFRAPAAPANTGTSRKQQPEPYPQPLPAGPLFRAAQLPLAVNTITLLALHRVPAGSDRMRAFRPAAAEALAWLLAAAVDDAECVRRSLAAAGRPGRDGGCAERLVSVGDALSACMELLRGDADTGVSSPDGRAAVYRRLLAARWLRSLDGALRLGVAARGEESAARPDEQSSCVLSCVLHALQATPPGALLREAAAGSESGSGGGGGGGPAPPPPDAVARDVVALLCSAGKWAKHLAWRLEQEEAASGGGGGGGGGGRWLVANTATWHFDSALPALQDAMEGVLGCLGYPPLPGLRSVTACELNTAPAAGNHQASGGGRGADAGCAAGDGGIPSGLSAGAAAELRGAVMFCTGAMCRAAAPYLRAVEVRLRLLPPCGAAADAGGGGGSTSGTAAERAAALAQASSACLAALVAVRWLLAPLYQLWKGAAAAATAAAAAASPTGWQLTDCLAPAQPQHLLVAASRLLTQVWCVYGVGAAGAASGELVTLLVAMASTEALGEQLLGWLAEGPAGSGHGGLAWSLEGLASAMGLGAEQRLSEPPSAQRVAAAADVLRWLLAAADAAGAGASGDVGGASSSRAAAFVAAARGLSEELGGAAAAGPGPEAWRTTAAAGPAAAVVAPRVCSSAQCGNFGGLAEAELRLLQCGGCRAVRYCSRECQQRDWRAGHKDACAGCAAGRGDGGRG